MPSSPFQPAASSARNSRKANGVSFGLLPKTSAAPRFEPLALAAQFPALFLCSARAKITLARTVWANISARRWRSNAANRAALCQHGMKGGGEGRRLRRRTGSGLSLAVSDHRKCDRSSAEMTGTAMSRSISGMLSPLNGLVKLCSIGVKPLRLILRSASNPIRRRGVDAVDHTRTSVTFLPNTGIALSATAGSKTHCSDRAGAQVLPRVGNSVQRGR